MSVLEHMTPREMEDQYGVTPDEMADALAPREWWNDEEKARDAAAQFGMTPEQMAEAGMHPDGTPYDSGPEDDGFAQAVAGIPDGGMEQGR